MYYYFITDLLIFIITFIIINLFLPFVVIRFNLDFTIKKRKRKKETGMIIFFPPLLVAVRYCDRCQVIKPDRCHHCSACDM